MDTISEHRFPGHCNREACKKPLNAQAYWHTSMRAWYCPECAERINHDCGLKICKDAQETDRYHARGGYVDFLSLSSLDCPPPTAYNIKAIR